MTDVLIGQAYFLRLDPKLWEAGQPYAPLGALYAAAVVRESGRRVALFDAMLAHSEHEWTEALDATRPRVAVIYEDSFNYLTKMCLLRMRAAALQMVRAAVDRGAVVVVAGSDATDHPDMYLDAGAAAVVVGEGERTLVEVLDALDRSAPPHDALLSVPGLALRTGRDVVRTPARAFIRDLDELPRPAWDLVDVERYRSLWLSRHGYFSMNLATTRGCPYRCNWCAKPIYGQRYATRAPEAVADELAWLKRTYRPDHVWIADDIFGLKPGWIDAFADAVERLDARVPYKCLLRADGVSSAVAAALTRSGCRTVWLGAESGSQRILDAMEKGVRVEDIEAAVHVLHLAGLQVGFFLQFGYLGEQWSDIVRTLDLVARCRPDDIGVSVSYPLPGTTFFERVRAQLGHKQNWDDSSDLALMYEGTFPAPFYRSVHAAVHAQFRAQRVRHGVGEALAAPWQLTRRRWRQLAGDLLHVPKAVWRRRALEHEALAYERAQAATRPQAVAS